MCTLGAVGWRELKRHITAVSLDRSEVSAILGLTEAGAAWSPDPDA